MARTKGEGWSADDDGTLYRPSAAPPMTNRDAPGWSADDTWAGWGEPDPGGEWTPRKPQRGRLLVGFAFGAATVLAVQFGGTVIASPPVAVVAGTALPAAGAAAPAARPATPAPPPPAPATTSTAPAAPAAQASAPPPPPPQQPGTVRLPSGGTASLVRKDLGPGGELPVPTDLRQATWWGAELNAAGGASVFAGHVNWRGATGPFAELWSARIGGEVTIVDSAGQTWRYRISQLVTVHKDDLPARADDLFGQSGPHRVVLVTCGGRWVGGSDGYEENRVVVADPA
ncbi:class F sortase [Amycolatopsis sp. MEPSY49]